MAAVVAAPACENDMNATNVGPSNPLLDGACDDDDNELTAEQKHGLMQHADSSLGQTETQLKAQRAHEHAERVRKDQERVALSNAAKKSGRGRVNSP